MTEWLTGDFLRVLNILLSLLVVFFLTLGTVAHWAEIPPRYQKMAPWIIAYGSWEVANQAGDVPIGFRVALMMLDLIGLLIAIIWKINDPHVRSNGEEGPTIEPKGPLSD